MAKIGEWSERRLSPLTIELDPKNPRIDVPDGAGQDEIRNVLLAQEEVIELARDIMKLNGLLYGDRIITTVEGGKQVVLEGNRRIAACQLLLRPSLIPAKYKARIPTATAALKRRIRSVPAEVAPSRDAAEPILTKRHTERGIKPWTPMAKMRRVARWVDVGGLSFEEAADRLGTTPAQVRRLIRPYRLLKLAMAADSWKPEEKEVLEGENLTVNPYTRFFTLSGTKEILGLSFDKDENAQSTLPATVFRKQLAKIVRDFLIPDPGKNRPRADTRTSPEEYFSDFLSSPEGKAAARAQAAASAKRAATARQKTGPRSLRASAFFEKLVCKVNDDNLIKLTHELSQVNHTKMPIAASVLLRGTLECALRYKIKRDARQVWDTLVQQKKGKDPDLSELLNAAANKTNRVFLEVRICDVLGSQQARDAKNHLDLVAHNHWRQADPIHLAAAANTLRNVISYILEGN